MKLDEDQYEFSDQLKRISIKGPAVSRALAGITEGEKPVVLRSEEGVEVVAMSLEE